MGSPRPGSLPDRQWTGHDYSMPPFPPLHAKVSNYLGEDSTTDLQETGSIPPGLFLDTWSEWKPSADSQVPPEDPVELKTMLPPSQGRRDAHGALSESELNGSRVAFLKESRRVGESRELSSGRHAPLPEAGQTLQNPFAATFPAEDDCQSLPMELRTIRRAPVGEADRQREDFPQPPQMVQTLRGCLLPDGGFDSEEEDAMELKTLRREDVLAQVEATSPKPPGAPDTAGLDVPPGSEPEGDLSLSRRSDGAAPVPEGLDVPPGSEPEGNEGDLALSIRSHGAAPVPEGQEESEASPTALPGGDLLINGCESQDKAPCTELDAEREILEAAATQSLKLSQGPQSLKLSQQSSHLTELVSEGAGPSMLACEEKPDASMAWQAGELVATPQVSQDVDQALPRGGAEEPRPSTLQDSASSPAHSAVTTPATSGYIPPALSKGAACDPVPGTVFTAEDEAVMGLKRPGGVEVVVESPRGKAAGYREPPSAPSARSEGSERPVGAGLNLQGSPAPVIPRPAAAQGRPPRGPATPAGSTESEQPGLPRRRTPSIGRRPLPKADAARRSFSAGRYGCGLQPNRKLVRNALEKTCLKGDANREQREQVLRSFDEDLERFDRFIILFRSIHTGRHDLRALYGFSEGSWSRVLQVLPSPVSLEERMVVQCLRYDSGGKEFKEVPTSQEPLSVADAVFVHPQFLQRSRVAVP